MSEKKRILYVGGFQLPDKNAAAHRVMGIGKSLRSFGFIVEYLDVSDQYFDESISASWTSQGFTIYTQRHSKNTKQRICYTLNPLHVEEVLDKQEDWCAIIAYNYPAIALAKLKKICQKRKIVLVSDCTEWYAFEPKNFNGLLTFIDSEIRMRFVQKRIDGIIAISEYIGNYYSKYIPTIIVPPLIDIEEDKWHQGNKKDSSSRILLTYAGSYSKSKSKDRLDIMVRAIEMTSENLQLNIIGYTREQYEKVFGESNRALADSDKIRFLGKVDHREALKIIQKSDYCVFMRKNTRVSQAGFPTKFVESITCGTPVITTDTSDLRKYIEQNGFIVNQDLFATKLIEILNDDKKHFCINQNTFDYHNFSSKINEFMNAIKEKQI